MTYNRRKKKDEDAKGVEDEQMRNGRWKEKKMGEWMRKPLKMEGCVERVGIDGQN